MRFLFTSLKVGCLIFIISGCLSSKTTNKKNKLNLFSDNGWVVDSLKNAYQAKKVTFDRWDASEVTDSTFSICLIDAKKLPDDDMEVSMNQFKSIGRAVKKAIKDPSKYNSYQIVFVETHDDFGESHRAGTTLLSSQL